MYHIQKGKSQDLINSSIIFRLLPFILLLELKAISQLNKECPFHPIPVFWRILTGLMNYYKTDPILLTMRRSSRYWYTIRGHISLAAIVVNNLDGVVLASIPIELNQASSEIIYDYTHHGYQPGVYSYSLVVDGKVMDTKR